MDIKILGNNGFCTGVKKAYEYIFNLDLTKYPKPIYMFGSLVHNKTVNDILLNKGIILLEGTTRLEMIEQVQSGTVIISAHGVSDNVINIAKSKGLRILNVTCPIVLNQARKIQAKITKGYTLLYLGKPTHPETETILSYENSYLLPNTPKNNELEKIFLASQTTCTKKEYDEAYNHYKPQFKHLEYFYEVCNETSKRQQILENEKINKNDILLILGDKTSNNCMMLYAIGKSKTNNTFLIEKLDDLQLIDFSKFTTCFISSATSTPQSLVKSVNEYLTKYISH